METQQTPFGAFDKVMRIGTTKEGGRFASVYVHATWNGERLSLTGVEGPLPSGNALGSCGQIEMHKPHIENLAPGWTCGQIAKLWSVWHQWHLNDMRSNCEHQRAAGITYQNDPANICETCGYKIGSAWLSEAVPYDVLKWLDMLPESDREPAWA